MIKGYRSQTFQATLLSPLLLIASSAAASSQTPSSPADALRSVDPTGYARAVDPRVFQFPEDHGAHPDFQLEWWYLTANVQVAEGAKDAGRRFGFQWTIFRSALAPPAEEEPRASSWATRQAYFGHFAVTDVAAERFHAFERHSRGAAGLAGVETTPSFALRLDDWELSSLGEEFFPLRVRAREGDVAIDLEIGEGKPLVLQGDEGLSRKGPQSGAASYYYSFTRLPLRGIVEVDGERFEVSGSGWIDREWMTNSLGEDQVGWDWFALQFDDGRDLMIGRVRRADGSVEPMSHGLLVEASGTSRKLLFEDSEVEVLETWTGDQGVVYPSRWRVRVPSADLDFEIAPRIPDQELDVGMRYWEGAIAATRGGVEIGRGYAELVGY